MAAVGPYSIPSGRRSATPCCAVLCSRCEGGDGVQQQLSSPLEVAAVHGSNTLIHLGTVRTHMQHAATHACRPSVHSVCAFRAQLCSGALLQLHTSAAACVSEDAPTSVTATHDPPA